MKFSQVIGHAELKHKLADMVQAGRVSHAMLFHGPSAGTGALPLAMAYATYVMCEQRTAQGDSCGQCPSCYQMSRMEHPDCHYVFPVNTSKLAVAAGRGDQRPVSDMFVGLFRELCLRTDAYFSEQELYRTIGLENAQGNINKSEASEVLRKMSFKAYAGNYKIVILWLPERMHEAAANSLLKLIEEPAPGTLFLLVSEQPSHVLQTIVSRCQGVSVPAIETIQMQQALELRGVDSAVAARAAAMSQGDWIEARLAAGLAEQDQDQALYVERFIALMRLCYSNKYLELFEWADSMTPLGREGQKQFCETALGLIRSCYLYNIGMEQIGYVDPQHHVFCTRFARFVDHRSVEGLVAEFETLLSQLRQNGNPKILFPHFALMICKLIRK